MSTSPTNPYRPPTSPVADVHEPGKEPAFGVPAAQVEAGRGADWIAEGWRLFKAAPLPWIVALIVLFGIQFVLGLIPLIGSIASLLVGPILMAGTLAFAQGIAAGEAADLNRLFAGFRERTGPLVTLALQYAVLLVGVVVLAIVAVVALFGSHALGNVAGPEQAMESLLRENGLAVLLVVLVAAALLVLAGAAYWFAPGLVFFAGLDATAALKASFSACMRNWLPLLVYGLLGTLVGLAGLLVFGVGLLVAMPVLMASYYASFRGLFGR